MSVKSFGRYPLVYVLCALWLVSVSIAANATGRVDASHPNYIRTVLLSKMISYTYWPQDKPHSDSEDVVICLIASNQTYLNNLTPFIGILNERRTDKGQLKVHSALISSNELKQESLGLPFECKIFYYSHLTDDLLAVVSDVAKQRGVLTISDSKSNLRGGTMVAFIEKQSRLKIFINEKQLDDSGVRLKSSLLRIANRI